MSGEDKHLGYLDMSGSIRGIHCDISDIIACEWLYAFIHVSSTLCVAMEADVAEVGLNESWFQIGYADGRVGHINAQTIAQCLYCSLGGAVNVTTSVGSIASHRTHVDDMTTITSHHAWNNEASHGEQALDVSINHAVPIVETALILRLQAQCQTSIVDQNVDVSPYLWKTLDGLLSCLAIAHVELDGVNLSTLGLELCRDIAQTGGVTTCKNQLIAIGSKLTGTG